MVHRLERLAIWLGATVGGVAFLIGAYTSQPETPAILLGVLYVLGFALLAVGVLGFASEVVVAVHGRLPGMDQPPIAIPPTPQTQPEHRRKRVAQPQERVFVPPSVTPLFLMTFFENHTEAQGKQSVAGYIGKWMRFSGTVNNVQAWDESAVISSHVDRAKQSVLSIGISMWFSEKWIDRVRLLNRDDPVQIIGRIAKLSHLTIELRDCELVS